jgi:hypothetical protein
VIHARADYTARVQDRLELIPIDEPVVLFRGQDVLTEEVVKFYIKRCRERGANDVADKMEKHLELIRAWPKKQVPDVPEGV